MSEPEDEAKRRASAFARAAIGSTVERPIPDPDLYRLAERFVREHPDGTEAEFLRLLKSAG